MLKEFVQEKHCVFYDSASDWKDAIHKACEPIIAEEPVESRKRLASLAEIAVRKKDISAF